MGKLTQIKEGTKTVRAFSENEVKRLLHLLMSKNHGTSWIHKRDIMLFCWTVNTGLRMQDILHLTVGQVLHQRPEEDISIIETKTKKEQTITMTPSMRKILDDYLEVAYPGILHANPDQIDEAIYKIGVRKVQWLSYRQVMDQPLFRSRKGGWLRSDSVGDMIASWANELGLPGRFGCHSLRKAFGTIHYHKHGTSIGVLCNAYNHENPSMTMRYLGITDKHVKACRLQEIATI